MVYSGRLVIPQGGLLVMESQKKIQVLWLIISFFLLFSSLGCALHTRKDNILAVVNNEPITREDVRYSLMIEHRREDLSSARELDISQFVEKLIDNQLIIQEAYQLGIDEDPSIKNAVQSFLTRESVMKLYDEEILQHISVTEEDILSYYKKNYEHFFLDIIKAKSEKEALLILEQLKSGESFSGLAEQYPSHFPTNENGEIVFARRALKPVLGQAVSLLEPGQYSETIEVKNSFYIVKLLGREEAPDDGLQEVRKTIESILKRERKSKLQKEYLEHLRKKASIKIHDDILSSLTQTKAKAEHDKMLEDERTLAEVNGVTLTVGKFLSMIPALSKKSEEKLLQNWIDTKLVDSEALSRHYEKKTDLGDKVIRYKNELLKRAFSRKIVAPGIRVPDTKLREYYEQHQENYMKPLYYKIQQITVKTRDEAREVLENLQKGAQFSWMAKTKSIDGFANQGGTRGWVQEKDIFDAAQTTLKSLSPGDISPIFETDSNYRIIRLLEKTEAEAKGFNTVKTDVLKTYAAEQFQKLYAEYLDALKNEAQITVYDDRIQTFEKSLKR
jgi:parvulin-like peptidyl-prolyl isomerase